MELAFDGQDDVEILLRLHKVPEVGCDHLRNLRVRVSNDLDRGLLLLLLLLLLVWLLMWAVGLVGLVVVIGGPYKVGYETLAQEAEFVLAHLQTRFGWLHCC